MKNFLILPLLGLVFLCHCQTVIDINSSGNGSNASNLTVFENKVYFSANDGVNGQGIYSVDNNSIPSRLSPGVFENPSEFTVLDNRLYFSSGPFQSRQLFCIENSSPNLIIEIDNSTGNPAEIIAHNGIHYFVNDDEVYLIYPSSFDAVSIGSTNGSSIATGMPNSTDMDRKYIFVASNKLFFNTANGIYYIDLIQLAGAQLVFNSANYQYELGPPGGGDYAGYFVGSKVVYRNIGVGVDSELLLIDANSSTPTADLINLSDATSSRPTFFIENQGILYFTAFSDIENMNVIWYIDGSASTIADFNFISGIPSAQTIFSGASNDPFIKIDNELFHFRNKINIVNGIPNISQIEECFDYPYFNHQVINYASDYYFIGCCFDLFRCNSSGTEKLTCVGGIDNAIGKFVLLDGKFYLSSPTSPNYAVELLRWPEDQGNGICQEDCMNDITVPTCDGNNFTVQLDPGQDYYTFNINDFASDECSPLLTYENASLDPSTPNGTTTHFWSGNNDQFACGTYIITSSFPFDDSGNFNDCAFTFIVECSMDACNNVALDFDGVDDFIELDSPFNSDQDYTIELWVKSESTSSGACSNNNSANLDWILAFDDNDLGIVDCADGYRVVFSPLCPIGNNLCSSLTAQPLNDDSWHHLAISEGSVGGFRVYYDGVKFTNFSNAAYDLSGKIRLGSQFGSQAGNKFKGKMDEFRVWNYIRSEEEILENYNCKIDPTSPGLITYYNFSDGSPGSDNLSVSEIADLVGNDQNGVLNNFNLLSDSSNFICDYIFKAPEYCTNDCTTDVVNLNTGIDFADDSELPIGAYEGGWQLISSPDDEVSFPRPSYVVDPNPAWAQLPGTQYISPFPDDSNNQSFSDPYVFERCFCICEPSSEISLDISAFFDNFLNLSLYDSEGNLIEELINYQGPTNNGTFTGDPYTSNTVHTLNTGTYCLRAGLRNDGGVAMGLAIQASVSGAGLIENGCCSPFTIVTGTVYQDDNCNGTFAAGSEEALQNVEVQLCNEGGEVVMTTTTDVFGYYSFFDVGVGSSIVKHISSGDQEISEGMDGYNIEVGSNSVTGDLDFGVCPPAYCTDECAADVVNLNTGIDFADDSELPIGEYEGGWQLISSPDDGVTFPRPSYVLNPNSAWAQLPGTQYISPYQDASNNQTFSDPYVFERCFCICDPSSIINLDVSAYFDNFLNLGLYDSQGVLIEELIDYQSPSSTGTFTGDPFESNTTHTLNTGTYCLRAALRNDGGVAMGLAIQASVSGAGLIENGCCSPFTIVTGTVYQDDNCNGTFAAGSEEALQNVEVQLCNEGGEVVMTTTTDVFGYYSFFDVGVGSSIVKHIPSGDQELSEGMGGYNIDVGSNSVTGDLDFGVCGDPCLMDIVSPILICTDEIIQISLDQSGSINITEVVLNLISAVDECDDNLIFDLSQAVFSCTDIGTNEITITATDDSGNSSTCTVTVLIEDKLSPTISCSGENVSLEINQNGLAVIGDTYLEHIDATDECGIESYSIDQDAFNCDQLGVNTVIVSVIDVNGNTAQCTLTYNIIDPNGYCEECCGTSEELTEMVQENINISTLIFNESLEFTLDNPNLLDCQYISQIIWGDGTVTNLNENDPLPTHEYEMTSVYLVTIEVSSIGSGGTICQTDEVSLSIIYNDCPVSTNFEGIEEYRLRIFPIPAREQITIDLSKNPSGYNFNLYNNLGQLIDQIEIESNIFTLDYDIGNLPNGIYNVVFEENGSNVRLESRVLKI